MSQRTADQYDGLNEYTVVDTDVHISIGHEELLPYLDDPHRGHVKHESSKPSSSFNKHRGGKIKRQPPAFTASDIEEGLCAKFGIDHPIINPTASELGRIPNPDFELALMRAYNDYLLDNFLDENGDFFGLLQLATSKPEKVAEEIDRLGDEPQIVGCYLLPLGPDAPLGDPRYDVIYQAAEDNDLAVAYHSGSGSFRVDFPKQYHGFNSFLPIHTLSHPWGCMQAMVSLIVEGTPEKFPDLDFLFLEAGIAWVPWMMWRLNKEYSFRKDEAPLLTKQPEEYIKEFYISTQPLEEPIDSRDMTKMLDIMDAPNTVVFSSDYPHWDFDNPSEIFKTIKTAHSDEGDIRKILSGNAIDAFDLDL